MSAAPLKVIVWGINYWPELTGIAPFNRGMCCFLEQEGHEVRMVSTFAYYPHWRKEPGDCYRLFRTDVIDDIPVHRCWHYVPEKPTTLTRILHELSFGLVSFFRVLSLPRADIYVVVSPPLLLGPLAWLVSLIKRSRYVFHVQDLQPDAALALGMMKKGWLASVLQAMASVAYRKAAVVSGISQAMLEVFAEKGVPRGRRYLFPNWVEVAEQPVAAPPPDWQVGARGTERRGAIAERVPGMQPEDASTTALDDRPIEAGAAQAAKDRINLVAWRRHHGIPTTALLASYSGNLGRKQGLEVLVDAAAELQRLPRGHSRTVFIVIAGDGAARPALEARIRAAGPSNLLLLPLLPDADYRALLATSDVCVITQAKGTGRFFLPSKLLSTLAAARPVAAVADEESELARAVREGEFGVVVPPENPLAIVKALSALADQASNLARYAQNGARWVTQFESRTVLSRFEARLREAADLR